MCEVNEKQTRLGFSVGVFEGSENGKLEFDGEERVGSGSGGEW